MGSPESILADANKLGLENIKNASIVDPKNHEKKKDYVDLMVKLRGHKGLTSDEAMILIEDPLYLGTLMIKNGDADGALTMQETASRSQRGSGAHDRLQLDPSDYG